MPVSYEEVPKCPYCEVDMKLNRKRDLYVCHDCFATLPRKKQKRSANWNWK